MNYLGIGSIDDMREILARKIAPVKIRRAGRDGLREVHCGRQRIYCSIRDVSGTDRAHRLRQQLKPQPQLQVAHLHLWHQVHVQVMRVTLGWPDEVTLTHPKWR